MPAKDSKIKRREITNRHMKGGKKKQATYVDELQNRKTEIQETKK